MSYGCFLVGDGENCTIQLEIPYIVHVRYGATDLNICLGQEGLENIPFANKSSREELNQEKKH